jgi:hypothetical protein
MSSLWDAANEIDQINCRITNVVNILELIATDIQDPQSGATWAARDMLEDLCAKMDLQISELMRFNREYNSKVEETLSKKAKKKKDVDIDGRC